VGVDVDAEAARAVEAFGADGAFVFLVLLVKRYFVWVRDGVCVVPGRDVGRRRRRSLG